jgi:hypothetical protein
MALVRRPQPPGDSGSRRNLVNRKGNVDSVEHAYPGIVNVYALVPVDDRGEAKPITLETFSHGMLSVATGSTRYSQGGTKKGGETVELARGPILYVWHFNSNQKRDGLYPTINGKESGINGSDATTASNSTHVNKQSYEQILRNQPSLVHPYDLTNPQDVEEIRKAISYVNNINNPVGSKKYEDAILRQAIRLQTTTDQVRRWAKERLPVAAMQQNKKQIETDIRFLSQSDKSIPYITKYLQQEYQLPPSRSEELIAQYTKGMTKNIPELPEGVQEHKQIEVIQEKLPRAFDETSGKVPSNKADYMPIHGDIIKTANKKDLYYDILPNGSVVYYIKTSSLSADRRRKLKNVKLKRVAYKVKKPISKKKIDSKKPSNSNKNNKCSRSSKMKKNLLNNIRCKCRRKK